MSLSAKIRRAEKLLEELKFELKSFFDTKPYMVETKRNSQDKKLIYYLAKVSDPPDKLALIAGDIIQNLRSSLDHLAHQFYVAEAGDEEDLGKHIYFPIADNAATYTSDSPRRVKGMRSDVITAIDDLKPYRGGDDVLWQLHKLSIIDKHRLLLTVGSSFQSVNIGKHTDFFKQFGVEAPDLFVKPASRMFPLKVGDELFVDFPGAEAKPMEFRFEIALNEREILKDESLIEALQRIKNHVKDTVDKLVQLL